MNRLGLVAPGPARAEARGRKTERRCKISCSEVLNSAEHSFISKEIYTLRVLMGSVLPMKIQHFHIEAP
jgi:hypothetical protein